MTRNNINTLSKDTIILKKHSLGENIPNKDTYIRKDHGVFIKDTINNAKKLFGKNNFEDLSLYLSKLYTNLIKLHEQSFINSNNSISKDRNVTKELSDSCFVTSPSLTSSQTEQLIPLLKSAYYPNRTGSIAKRFDAILIKEMKVIVSDWNILKNVLAQYADAQIKAPAEDIWDNQQQHLHLLQKAYLDGHGTLTWERYLHKFFNDRYYAMSRFVLGKSRTCCEDDSPWVKAFDRWIKSKNKSVEEKIYKKQRKFAKKGELQIHKLLMMNKVCFKTEYNLRREGKLLTPDYYIPNGIMFRGNTYYWIEVKNRIVFPHITLSWDIDQMSKSWGKYHTVYGDGIVCWTKTGFPEGLPQHNGVMHVSFCESNYNTKYNRRK